MKDKTKKIIDFINQANSLLMKTPTKKAIKKIPARLEII